MTRDRLLGWDMPTWHKVFAWAGEPKPFNLSGPFDEFLAVRRKWLEAGGPSDGPVSDLVLSA